MTYAYNLNSRKFTKKQREEHFYKIELTGEQNRKTQLAFMSYKQKPRMKTQKSLRPK